MTEPIIYQAPSLDHDEPVTRTGWPTNTPGLLISRDDPELDYADQCTAAPCWRIVHQPSGLRIAHCLTQNNARWAAATLGRLTNWDRPAAELAPVPTLAARARDVILAAGGRFDLARHTEPA